MNKIFVAVIALVLLAGGIVVYVYYGPGADPVTSTTTGEQQENVGRVMDIETYVRQNISDLSTEPEVLGGTFYVTFINATDGSGVVEYEDGHNAFAADFTYTIDSESGISIKTFTIRR